MKGQRTKVIVRTETSMPFDLYVIPASDTRLWADYIRTQSNLKKLFNCVYLLAGHDFIYAGKSVNGDRILGHIEDESKLGFDYQFLFVPNNENPFTMSYWTSDFMSLLESMLIDRINPEEETNPYCKNAIRGKDKRKSWRDLNINEDKENFADNVISLIFDCFSEISCSSYLLPESARQEARDERNLTADSDYAQFWKELIDLSKMTDASKEFAKLTPSKYSLIGLNIGKLIPSSSIACALTKSSCRVELTGWGGRQYAQTNLEVFDTLYSHKEEIEKEIGCNLIWDRGEGKFTTRISISKSLSYRNSDIGNIRDISDFFVEYFQKFYEVLTLYYQK